MYHNPKTYLVCGSGGVGKTTISAALGLKFALNGYKTLVLTIDPAKRLASSLGISKLDNSPKRIDIAGNKSDGAMYAMMLDTKKTFDSIVEKYAPSREAMLTILNNRIYQHMSQMLAGTQEYMAMEKLYEIHQQHDYDVIVLDTPPMQNAIEFLAAPQKMVDMIHNSMLQLLLKPALFFSKSGLKILEKGAKQIFKVLDSIAGLTFLQELSEMFLLLKDLLGGFKNRAEKVRQLLSNQDVCFISVCTTNENSLSETYDFKRELETFNYKLEKVIVNRVYKGDVLPENKINEIKKNLKQYFTNKESAFLIENYSNFIPLVLHDKKQLEELNLLAGKNQVVQIPLFLSDVHDLESLKQVADEIGGSF